MRSLFAKILLWFWCTLAITVVGAAFITALTLDENASNRQSPFARLLTLELEEARTTYESGGRPALRAFLENLQRVYGATGILTDQTGRDLLTGANRSDLLRRAQRIPRLRPLYRLFLPGGGIVARAADDGHYWFFFMSSRPRVGTWFFTPDHLFVLGVAALMCYWLALHLTAPVRDLQRAVERFGRGDLQARVGSTRRDELGRLARTFDRMADRIATLLAAERRLLLDISHELRSPLARLGVAVELARSGDNLDSALNRIQKESDRLNSLVGQLLEVTRAEGDPNSLRREPVRLDDLVRELVDASGIEASARGCRLQYENSDPVVVEGDPELLRRAVENVIRNAIRYSPPESAVKVSLARNNGTAVLDVRDYGPGVPEDSLPRLFDAFYRVESDRGRSSGGIGLGLSIARRALDLHHGTIHARNCAPGLEVEIELPAKYPDAGASAG